MAERRDDGAWLLSQRVLPMPVEIRSATTAVAVFTCSSAAARQAVGDSRLEVLSIRGRAAAVFVCVSYLDGDLDSYDEVGFGVLVRPRGVSKTTRPPARPGIFTFELPVTAEFTREAGVEIWALPKWVADADMRFGPSEMTVSLAEDGELAMTGRFRRGRFRIPFRVSAGATGWSTRSEAIIATRSTTRLRDVRIAMGGTTITTGPHRMGKTIEALQLSRRSLVTVTASMAATINDAEPVIGSVASEVAR